MESTKRRGIIVVALAALFLAAGCANLDPPQPEGDHPPVIDDWWASPTATWNETWRLYIKAHDPDGDMWDVDFRIDQPGVMYDPGQIILPEEARSEMEGYISWLMPPMRRTMLDVELSMTVRIMDWNRNQSRSIIVPLTLGQAPQKDPPPGWPDRHIAAFPLALKTPY
jgi:hypothetical protein